MSPIASLPSLSDSQIERYSRQIILPEIGATQQRVLLASSVTLAATPVVAAQTVRYLAAAGVGRVELIEGTQAAPFGSEFNSDTHVTARDLRVTRSLNGCAAVIDAAESTDVHERLNRACVSERVPLILGDASGFLTVLAGSLDAPCFACVEWPAPRRAGDDVVGDLCAALIGTLIANEAIKCILGIGAPLYGRILSYDPQQSEFLTGMIAKDPACRVCCRAH